MEINYRYPMLNHTQHLLLFMSVMFYIIWLSVINLNVIMLSVANPFKCLNIVRNFKIRFG